MKDHVKQHIEKILSQKKSIIDDWSKKSSILDSVVNYGIEGSEFGKLFSIQQENLGSEFSNLYRFYIRGFVQDQIIFEAKVDGLEQGVEYFLGKIKEFIEEVYGDTEEKIPFDIYY